MDISGISRSAKVIAIALWPIGFASSASLPTWIGWHLTHEGGRVGLVLVMTLVFLCGLWVCGKVPEFALTTTFGGAALGLIQLLSPKLVYFTGLVAFGGAMMVGAASFRVPPDLVDDPDAMAVAVVHSELGGMLIAGLTSAMMIAFAVVLGQGVRIALKPFVRSLHGAARPSTRVRCVLRAYGDDRFDAATSLTLPRSDSGCYVKNDE